jgi:hypothetical protein
MATLALIFLQPLLRHRVSTDTLDDPGAFANSHGQAKQVVNLFGTQEGVAIEDDGSSWGVWGLCANIQVRNGSEVVWGI